MMDHTLNFDANIKWVGNEEKAIGLFPDGSKAAVRFGSEVTTLEEVVYRLRERHKGDDLPIVLEAFGCEYDAACDAVFGGDQDKALAMLNAACAVPMPPRRASLSMA